MRNDETAALRAATALLEPPAPEVVPEPEAPALEVPDLGPELPEPEEETFDFEVDVPEDLLAELDEPEVTPQDIELELEASPEYQDLDEEGRRLYARARAAEREAAYFKQLRLQDAKKAWNEEAQKFFPLAAPFLDEISEESRKGFLRRARDIHNKILPSVKQSMEQDEAQRQAAIEEAKVAARAEAEAAWGVVPPDHAPPTEARITQDELARNRSKGDLASTIRAMIFPTKES